MRIALNLIREYHVSFSFTPIEMTGHFIARRMAYVNQHKNVL